MQEDADKPQTPGGNTWSRRDAGTPGDEPGKAQPENERVAEADSEAPGETIDGPNPAAELNELQDKLLRTLADMENLRRRHTRELEDARKYGLTGFARDLLDVADNMRRALAAVPDDARTGNELVQNLLEGVELTERTLLNAFDKHGVKKVVPERGEKFDHNRHQAMFEVPTADLPPGHIADVMQTGWVISDRLLRPAMVGVTKAAPKPAPAQAPDAAPEAMGDAADTRGKTLDTNA
jgi:molecular chaperone GrpE